MATPEEKHSEKQDRFETRLSFLEKKHEEAHRFFRHTLSAITIIFLFVGIIMAVLSISSKNEVNDAIREMERKFEILSQQALKKPQLEIFYKGEPVSGKTIEVNSARKFSLHLEDMFIKNVGEKVAQKLSIKFYFSEAVETVWEPILKVVAVSADWRARTSSFQKYPSFIKPEEDVSLNPGETWTVPPFELNFGGADVQRVSSKLMIFYGVDKPAEVEFIFNLSEGE